MNKIPKYGNYGELAQLGAQHNRSHTPKTQTNMRVNTQSYLHDTGH